MIPASLSRRELFFDLCMIAWLALGIRMLWVFLTPAWMAPDEPAHFTYVMHLAEQWEIPHPPPYDHAAPEVASEVMESLSTLLFRRMSRKGGPRRPELVYLPVHHDYRELRAFTRSGDARKSTAGAAATPYPPLYYALGALGYLWSYDAPLLSRLHAVRAVSALLSALSCCFGYLFALELMRDRAWARALGAAMALLPMYAFISATVNNDAGMILAASALCWFWARAFSRKTITVPIALGLGSTAGLVMLMKPSATALVLVAAVTTLVYGVTQSRDSLRARVAPFFVFLLSFAVVYGPWLAYRLTSPAFVGKDAYSQEGDVVAGLLHPKFSFLEYLVYQWGRGFPYLRKVFVELAWGHFGWIELPLPSGVYTLIAVLYVAAAIGLGWMIKRRERRALLAWLAVLCGAQICFIFLLADYLISFAKTGEPLYIQGRYFYPVIAPLFLLLFLGLHELFGRRRWVILSMPFLMLTVQMLSLYLALERWYGVGIG
jgi:hypothetical protein